MAMGATGRRWLAIGGAVLALILVALLALYAQRKPLAQGFIDRELARRGVPASYRVAGIGLRWERLENIRLGDPAAPDLTADWAEVRVTTGWSGVSVTAIRAGGVRLRGRLANGAVNLGSVDRLLPNSTSGPFRLPDLDVDLSDARIRLDTAFGQVGARLDGRGNLAGGFKGKLAAIMPRIATHSCMGDRVTAYIDLSIANRSPHVTGPVRAVSARCGDAGALALALRIDAGLSEAFDRWTGRSSIEATRLGTGDATLQHIGGTVAFTGSRRDTLGALRLTADAGAYDATHAAGLALTGRYRLAMAPGFDGTIRIARVSADPAYAAGLQRIARQVGGTSLAPLIARLAETAGAAGRDFAVTADLATPSPSAFTVTRFVATARSGAVMRVEGGQGIRVGTGGFAIDSTMQLSGGGLPDLVGQISRSTGSATRGLIGVAPYAANGARIVLSPVTVIGRGDHLRLETQATLDGPLGDGHVTGLRAPVLIDASGGRFAVNPGCTPLAWRDLAVSSLRLDAATLYLCAPDALVHVANGKVSGGGTLGAARLSGQLGGAPIALAARGGSLSIAGSSFILSAVTAQLGDARRLSKLNIGALAGRFAGGGLSGQFASTGGEIGNVPLRLSDGAGRWAFRAGALTLATDRLTVADVDKRFNPLAGEGVKLRLADNRVMMSGRLVEPALRSPVADVTIAHDLRSGTGRAHLAVAGLYFGKQLQPEALTPLALGVIANLQGRITGMGDIAWSGSSVTSIGQFSTKGLDFAAAFGPVTGLRGTIEFSNLLELVTPPGQVVTIDQVNPGTPVKDGRIGYHLAPGQVIAIESGRWPFAGGELLLDPADIEMAEHRARRLTFRVAGLDAAKFIEQLQFEDLAATGIFDGALPMVFDETGGRIERGHLAARPGGGTLAYVGAVSNAAMNAYAKLAFDALKSLRYRDLTIDLDGALDGEMISRIVFSGVSQGEGTKSNFIIRRLAKLPFKFNVTIRAPFRALLNTARGLQDPSAFLTANPVQPPESEPKP